MAVADAAASIGVARNTISGCDIVVVVARNSVPDGIPGCDVAVPIAIAILIAIAISSIDIDTDNNLRLARVEGGKGDLWGMGTVWTVGDVVFILVFMLVLFMMCAGFAREDLQCSPCSRFANNDNWLTNRPLRHDRSRGAFHMCSLGKICGEVLLKIFGPYHNCRGVQWEHRREGNRGSIWTCPVHSNSDSGWDWEATFWLPRVVDVDFSTAIRAPRLTR